MNISFVTLADLSTTTVASEVSSVSVAGSSFERSQDARGFADATGQFWVPVDGALSPAMFGAIVDDGLDDTAAWKAAIAAAASNEYFVQAESGLHNAANIDVFETVEIVFSEGAEIDFGGNDGFILNDAGIALESAVVSNVRYAVYGVDELETKYPTIYPDAGVTLTGSIDVISIRGSTFVDNVMQPVFVVMKDNTQRVDSFVFADNQVEGGWNALVVAAALGTASLTNNTISNMDPSSYIDASTGLGVGIGVGGIKLGRNSYVAQQNTGPITVSGNTITDIHDNRADGQNINAIMVLGGRGVDISDNVITRTDNRTGQDSEAIYVKGTAVVIAGNTLTDAGQSQGAIAINGRSTVTNPDTQPPLGTGAIISGNTIINTRDAQGVDPTYGYTLGDTFAGIYLSAGDVSVYGNTLVGVGGVGSDYAAIATAYNRTVDNIVIAQNTFRDAFGDAVLSIRHNGSGLTISDNRFEGSNVRVLTVDTISDNELPAETLITGTMVFGTQGNDAFIATFAAENFSGGAGRDQVSYDAADRGIDINLNRYAGQSGGAEGDQLTSIEVIYATSFADTLYGNDGNNWLIGQDGNDNLIGRRGIDFLRGGDGSDMILGGSGADVLLGERGSDLLGGGAGNDSIRAGSGADIINGMTGNDVLTGGSGGDTFVFEANWGEDVITDFNALQGDRLSFQSHPGIGVNSDLTIVEDQIGLIISAGDDSIILAGIDLLELPNDAFLF